MSNKIALIVLTTLLVILMVLREFEPFSTTLTDVIFFLVLIVVLWIYLYEFMKKLRA